MSLRGPRAMRESVPSRTASRPSADPSFRFNPLHRSGSHIDEGATRRVERSHIVANLPGMRPDVRGGGGDIAFPVHHDGDLRVPNRNSVGTTCEGCLIGCAAEHAVDGQFRHQFRS
jgi:hypothetical protein